MERELSQHPRAVAKRLQRAQMTKEERDRERAMQRRARYLRETGRGLRATPEEAAAARARLQSFRKAGMSYELMAQRTGMWASTICDFIAGRNATITRRTLQRIMELEFEVPVGAPRSERRTARVEGIGTQRRLRALWADGWPSKLLAEMLDMRRQNLILLIEAPPGRRSVHYQTHAEVKALYEKLAGVKPVDHGVSNFGVSVAKSWASRKGCAPSHCWDPETLDDPDAAPEWTGKCGTTAGYKIHAREGIPLCTNCINAKAIYRRYPCLAHLAGITEER